MQTGSSANISTSRGFQWKRSVSILRFYCQEERPAICSALLLVRKDLRFILRFYWSGKTCDSFCASIGQGTPAMDCCKIVVKSTTTCIKHAKANVTGCIQTSYPGT
ncbi:hypothetical protein SKAU_G00425260 [Synaphobranchus kaupii]|uniref:Uncharacterized protein n=1 Tax=Synaphobranchus kaupii TaxID=118154 RepID=A0A9Q1E5T8_SYNKA|nr:hypothetical protein SKAU_G00425260 [Synaphobranchus kaupii]